MTFREKWRKFLLITLIISILFTAGYGYFYLKDILPERITVVVDENGYVNLHVPFSGTLSSDDESVVLYDETEKLASDNTVAVGMGKNAILNASETGSYELVYRLFGLIDFQKIQVNAVESETLIPCGMAMGLYLETDGVMVVGTSEITDIYGNKCIPAEDLLERGDYICAVNNEDISSKDDLIDLVQASDGNVLELSIRRADKMIDVQVTPVEVADSDYKLGVWVRDDCQGIGTVTFVDGEGHYGALGHGISDVDTGMRVDSHEGNLREAQIHSILKGQSGTPGSLCGTICYQSDALFGDVCANTEQGVFGNVNAAGMSVLQEAYKNSGLELTALPIGYQQEVTTGTAYIRSAVSGEIQDYEIQITAVDVSKGNKNKGIVLEVTDERLLALTGGIVQGMSGSPILQNGKIIGAVTHVFVQDSTKGYGIFIEKMLNAAEAAEGN